MMVSSTATLVFEAIEEVTIEIEGKLHKLALCGSNKLLPIDFGCATH